MKVHQTLALLLCAGLFGWTFVAAAKAPVRRGKWAALKANSSIQTEQWAASIKRKGRFRSNWCWKRFREVRQTIRRQERLLKQFASFPCDATAWKRCKQLRYRTKQCRSRKQRTRWGRCFRLHRRLYVMAYRLTKWNQKRRKRRCRWLIRIPERFDKPLFEPFPRISKDK